MQLCQKRRQGYSFGMDIRNCFKTKRGLRELNVTPKKKPAEKNIIPKKPLPKEVKDLSGVGLFELSIEGLIPYEVFREIKWRLETILALLRNGTPRLAMDVAEDLLKEPQASNNSKTKQTRRSA